jgi:hypothetical protein
MSAIASILSGIANVLTPSADDIDPTPSGAEAVRQAITERDSLKHRQFTGTLGEPDVKGDFGTFFGDPKVVIPVKDAPYGIEDIELVFDVPESGEADLYDILDGFGVSVERVGELEGKEVSLRFENGNPVVNWDAFDTSKETERENAAADPESESDDQIVNVEETTVSSESAAVPESEQSDKDSSSATPDEDSGAE